MAITRFDRNTNRGTAVCEHCGKRTWRDRIECGYCERCNQIFMCDNTLADDGPDSEEGRGAIEYIKIALSWKDYPPFPDDHIWNSKVTAQLVAEHVAREVA